MFMTFDRARGFTNQGFCIGEGAFSETSPTGDQIKQAEDEAERGEEE